MFGYIKITAAVPKIFLGDVDANASEIAAVITEKKDSDIIVFPELALTGCSAGDLFFQSNLTERIPRGIMKIVEAAGRTDSLAVFGLPLMLDGSLYNCAVSVRRGRILGITVKSCRSYSSDDNGSRWFSPGENCTAGSIASTALGLEEEYAIPVGAALIYDFNGIGVSCVLGEDSDTPVPLSGILCSRGAQVILNLSAAYSLSGESEARRRAVRHMSRACRCIYAYTSAGCFESTGHGVYGGEMIICENGTVLGDSTGRITGNGSLTQVADTGTVLYKRLRRGGFSGNYAGDAFADITVVHDRAFSNGIKFRKAEKYPFNPEKNNLDEECLRIFNIQAAALKRRLEVTGSRPVLGVSGGLDSTLALLVCVKAEELMGNNPDRVIGITLPCFGTSERTHSNATALLEALGAQWKEIDIKNACTGHCADIGHPADLFDVTYENIQARERTQVLMDYAGSVGGLVVGTGDLSEMALGWCTYNGDHMSMYAVNGDVPKTLIREIIAAVIRAGLYPDAADILRDIAETPISPELLPPDENGAIAQQTEDIIGPYVLHDFFIYHMLSEGCSPSKLYYLAQKTFEDEFDGKTVLKWLKVFYKRFFTSQFKRSCQPDGVRVLRESLSYAGDWIMPSDASFKMWLKETEELE